MALSVKNLAARLDALDASEGSFVAEGEVSVTVSGLSVSAAREIADLCTEIGWASYIEDNAGTPWVPAALDEDFAPFRLSFDKPAAPEGVLRLLTNSAFGAWLEREDQHINWQVVGLKAPLRSYAITFTPWSDIPAQIPADDNRRKARSLVREFSGQHSVPASLNRWLIADPDTFPDDSQTSRVWAKAAARNLMLALPDEFDSEACKLRFKGPPRLDLKLPETNTDLVDALGREGFVALQAALHWVFETEREAEMRHILLATELARSGGTGEAAEIFVRENIRDALTGAKLAYQVQLAGMSSDALKTLSDLRKTISDDTAKVAENTRQIITAAAGSLAIGVGLIAARLSGSVNPVVVAIVMGLAAIYLAITIISGVLFTLLQRRVRKAWQPRLYRFLSEPDYRSLVGEPAKLAESALWISSALGVLAIVLISLAIARVEPQVAPTAEPTSTRNDMAAVQLLQTENDLTNWDEPASNNASETTNKAAAAGLNHR